MARTTQTAVWNRDDRDLIIELKTNMQNVRDEVAQARVEIKEINTGITARLLNLESNAVSKIQIEGFDERLRALEDLSNQWLGKQQLIGGAIGLVAGLIGAFIQSGRL